MHHEFDLPHDSPSGSPDAPPADGSARAEVDADSLRVAVDACRPGSDDRRLPEVAEILARHPAAAVERLLSQSEQVDRAIMGAMRSLPAPDRLAERLMAALALRRAELAHEAECQSGEAVADAACPAVLAGCAAMSAPCAAEAGAAYMPASRPNGPRRALRPWAIVRGPRTRRAWLATVSLALVGVAAAYFAWPTHRRLVQEEVEQSAREFYLHDNHAAALSRSGKGNRSWPRTVVVAADHRGWRTVDNFLGRSGVAAVAHELVGPRGIPATLYVVPLGALGAVGFDHSVSQAAGSLTSGAPTARAWAEGNDLFVLVVKGTSRDLNSFLSTVGYA